MHSLRYLYKIGHGPSSSHTMGPGYAAKLFKEKNIQATSFQAVLFGSLALTGKGHLTDEVIKKTFEPFSCHIIFDSLSEVPHPNTFDLYAFVGDHIMDHMRCYSVGGGTIMIEGEACPQESNIYPFTTWKATKDYLLEQQIDIPTYVKQIEGSEFASYIEDIYQAMKDSIARGLATEGLLPGSLKVIRKAKKILNTNVHQKLLDISQKIYAYAYAVSEENASGGVVVTAPTCGASGVLPALMVALEPEYGYDKMIEALMVAGLFGNLVKENGSISGAEAGCQAEIGTACSMAAAASAFLLGGNLEEIEQAAEMALEHHLGLTCDPIGGYVQIPCIERCAVCAIRAYDCAKLSKFLETGTNKISFDLVVKTMLETGKDLNQNYRETSIGGLAKKYQE